MMEMESRLTRVPDQSLQKHGHDEGSGGGGSGGGEEGEGAGVSVRGGMVREHGDVITMNKVLMGEHFALPVFLTFLHMMVSFLWCEFSMTMGWTARGAIKSRAEGWKVFFLSLVMALSVLLAVASFKYVDVSLEQALAASSPAFTAAMGVVILKKRERGKVWLTLLPVVGGAMISAGGVPEVSWFGVTLVILSNIARGTKSCMQELLLVKDALDSINLLRYMAAFSCLTLLPFSVVFEGPAIILERLSYVSRDGTIAAALVANCTGAFMVNLFQFQVTENVGALSMQVLGNLKNVFTSTVSVFVFRNAVTSLSIVGYGITMAGAWWYNKEKNREKAAAGKEDAAPSSDPEAALGK